MALKVTAPLSGTLIELSAVPDPVFAGALVGPGVAIEPDHDATLVRAPVDGTLVKVKPHAFVVLGNGNRGVLVHLGIDTVRRNGDGFTMLAAEGSTVRAGDPVIEWQPDAVRAGGLSAACPIIALDASAIDAVATGRIAVGDTIFTWH